MFNESPIRIEFPLVLEQPRRGRRRREPSEVLVQIGHVPRITRMLALAHHFEHLIAQGVVKDYAEIARLTQLTRARVTQIVDLKFLAPEIQEAIADLPRVHGKDPITEKQMRQIAHTVNWEQQRRKWRDLLGTLD